MVLVHFVHRSRLVTHDQLSYLKLCQRLRKCLYLKLLTVHLFLAAHSDSIVGYNFVVISCMFLVVY